MTGELPVWLFVLCLLVAVPSAFVGGYTWAGFARRRRLKAQVRAARRRLEARERARLAGDPTADFARPVDTTRFTR